MKPKSPWHHVKTAHTSSFLRDCSKEKDRPAKPKPQKGGYGQQSSQTFTISRTLIGQSNLDFIGTVGLGKTHLASAIGRRACLKGYTVLFESAATMVNNLTDAQRKDTLKAAMRRYEKPQLLIIDELGYLPVDKIGAELLFQVFGSRYEKSSTIITTNRTYKEWAKTFANDAVMTSAVLDRILHHCETAIIEGESYRMKDRIETSD